MNLKSLSLSHKVVLLIVFCVGSSLVVVSWFVGEIHNKFNAFHAQLDAERGAILAEMTEREDRIDRLRDDLLHYQKMQAQNIKSGMERQSEIMDQKEDEMFDRLYEMTGMSVDEKTQFSSQN